MAAGDLVTVAQVRPFLLLQPNAQLTEDLGLFQTLIAGVSEEFRSVLNRGLLSSTYVEQRDGTGTNMLTFGEYPVTAVSSVVLGADPLNLRTLAPDAYVWTRTSIKLRSGIFAEGVGNVTLSYTAGYATLPADLTMAAAKAVAFRYRQLSRLGQNSKSMGQETVQFETQPYPKDVQNILNQYSKKVPV